MQIEEKSESEEMLRTADKRASKDDEVPYELEVKPLISQMMRNDEPFFFE